MKPPDTLNSQFTSAKKVACIYHGRVQLPIRPALFFTAILCVSATLAVLALWVFSRARTPFDYMVVGTLAAAAALVAAFVIAVKRKLI